MATDTKKRKGKKLRAGNSDLPPTQETIPLADDAPILPLEELLEADSDADAEGWPEGKAYVDGVNIDKPLPIELPAEGPLADAVDELLDEIVNAAEVTVAAKPDSPEALAAYDADTAYLVEQAE